MHSFVGWYLGRLVRRFDESTPSLFKRFNYDVAYTDGKRGQMLGIKLFLEEEMHSAADSDPCGMLLDTHNIFTQNKIFTHARYSHMQDIHTPKIFTHTRYSHGRYSIVHTKIFTHTQDIHTHEIFISERYSYV